MRAKETTENSAAVVITKGLLVNPKEEHRTTWVGIPFGQDELWLAKVSIGVGGDETLPFCSYGGFFKDAGFDIAFDDLDELFRFHSDIEDLVRNEKALSVNLNAVFEAEKPESIEEARYLMEHLDAFIFRPGITESTELGKRIFSEKYGDDVVNEAGYFIDFETYGQDYMNFHDHGCTFTSLGAVERTEDFRPFDMFDEGPGLAL